MLESFLILVARVSNAVINRYADKGHPCLTPTWRLKLLPVLPLFKTVEELMQSATWYDTFTGNNTH